MLFAIVFVIVIITSSLIAHLPQRVHPELIPVAFAAVIVSMLFDPRIGMIAAMILAVLIGGQNGSSAGPTRCSSISLGNGRRVHDADRASEEPDPRRDPRDRGRVPDRRGGNRPHAGPADVGHRIERPLGCGERHRVGLDRHHVDPGRGAVRGRRHGPDAARVVGPQPAAASPVEPQAPGTYAHTIAIANLAESASNAIGANGLLARVGALYHDIRKLKKPQYFAENQAKGRNPHDKLKPTTSAAIVRNHVLEGLELAEEYKLPRGVMPFIREHHGTGPISYFLEKAKERDGMPANSAEFAYPGPAPRSIETAIVMLADGAEAAARVLHDPTPQKIREVIDRIVRQRIDQGQLPGCADHSRASSRR